MRKIGVKWTHEMYVKKVNELVGNEFEVRGQYIRNDEKILMYHKACDREFLIRPADFKNRKRCSLCNGKFKKTTQQFKQEVSELSGDSYSVIGEYINDRTHIKMRHEECGYIWNATPSHFIQGKRCPKCGGCMKKTTQEFRRELLSIVSDEYTLNSEYINSHRKVSLIHNSDVCNFNNFEMTPTDFLTGKRCPKCKFINQSGENHWNYNPNLTEIDRQKRDMFNGELRKWRDAIYERDGYICQICNRHSHQLNAHHLNSWDTHRLERFSLENGITLCYDCHRKFHTIYGFGKNTKEQFISFKTSI